LKFADTNKDGKVSKAEYIKWATDPEQRKMFKGNNSTHTHTITLSHYHTVTHYLSLSLSHKHTITHYHTITHNHNHNHTITHNQTKSMIFYNFVYDTEQITAMLSKELKTSNAELQAYISKHLNLEDV
jgi:hypothetical protein